MVTQFTGITIVTSRQTTTSDGITAVIRSSTVLTASVLTTHTVIAGVTCLIENKYMSSQVFFKKKHCFNLNVVI